jgi:hypothetical protein
MSSTCAKKEKLTLVASEVSYVISTPEARWMRSDSPEGSARVIRENIWHQPYYFEWARYKCHPRDELNEDAQGHIGHSHQTRAL